MKPDELERLRQHYDHTDLSGSIDRARLDTDVDPNPMVTTSLRLPKDVLDWRARAGRCPARQAHRADPAVDRGTPQPDP
ncbi:hypothetical protein C8E95_6894 [Pseudonocardia autotrophica]|nr:hypothetical protein C8E95_6894 [Pseudonocardia autotrophica]